MSEQDYIKTLKDYTPDWMRDGTGIRGPAQTVQRFGGGVEFPHASIQQTVQPGNEPLDQPGFGGPTPIGGSSTTLPIAKFQPYFRYSGSTPQWGVYHRSAIYSNGLMNAADSTTPSGLLSADFSTGWLNIDISSPPDRLWVEIAYDTGSWPDITGASVKSTGHGDSWNGGAWQYLSDGGSPARFTQSFSRVLIAEAVSDSGGNPDPSVVHSGGLMFRRTGVIGYDSSGRNPEPIAVLHPFPV